MSTNAIQEHQKDCIGPKWVRKGFWSGKTLIFVFISLLGLVLIIGGIGITNKASMGAHIDEGRRQETRIEQRLQRIEDKIDKLADDKFSSSNPD